MPNLRWNITHTAFQKIQKNHLKLLTSTFDNSKLATLTYFWTRLFTNSMAWGRNMEYGIKTAFRHVLGNFINKLILPKKPWKNVSIIEVMITAQEWTLCLKWSHLLFPQKQGRNHLIFDPVPENRHELSSKRRTRPEFLGQFSNIHFYLLRVQSIHLLHTSFYRGIKK